VPDFYVKLNTVLEAQAAERDKWEKVTDAHAEMQNALGELWEYACEEMLAFQVAKDVSAGRIMREDLPESNATFSWQTRLLNILEMDRPESPRRRMIRASSRAWESTPTCFVSSITRCVDAET
jgi:hypothetical protein